MDVFPDFDGLAGIGDLKQVVGALCMFVLIIGVLVSLFTAVSLSRMMLRIVVRQKWARKAAYYGVTEEEFEATQTTTRVRTRGEASARV